MKAPQQVLLLVGSPKPGESTSESLGRYLLDDLEGRGVKTQTLHVVKAVRSDESIAELQAAVAAADLVVFSFPLYVDSLPAPAIRTLELIAAECAGRAGAQAGAGGAAGDGAGDKAFLTICQSGFPEVDHNEVAVEICRNFVQAAGFEWAGGLILPAGGMLGGQPLAKMKGMMRTAVRSLDLSAEALAAGRPVPDEAVRLMAKLPIPAIGYRLLANRGWHSQFKKHGEGESLKAQPFA
jgi:hypothetical protein